MLRVLNKISDAANEGTKVVCGIMMGYLAIVCTIQVFFRYVVNNSLTWSEESMRYVFIWMILLATATTIKEGSGAAIDILGKKLTGRVAKSVYQIVIFLLCGITAYILIRYGIQFLLATVKARSAAIQIPMWVVYASVPVGSLLTLLHCVNGIALAIDQLIHPENAAGDNGKEGEA